MSTQDRLRTLARQLEWRRRFEGDEKGEGPARGLEARRKKGDRRGHRRWFAGLSTRPVRVYLYVVDGYAKTKRDRAKRCETGRE
jgi:hypothetical protein